MYFVVVEYVLYLASTLFSLIIKKLSKYTTKLKIMFDYSAR